MKTKHVFFQVAKVFHATVSSLLPVAVFRFTNVIFHSTDVATVAAVLVSFSSQLQVLGTHTIINSVLSPAVIFLLASVFEQLNVSSKKCELDLNSPKQVETSGDSSALDNNQNPTIKPIKTNWPLNQNRLSRKYLFHIYVHGVLLGLICYMRLDVAALVAILTGLFWLDNVKVLFVGLSVLGAGLVGGALLGGVDDYIHYGVFGISPIQWFVFNIRNNYASKLFGWQGAAKYITDVFFDNYVTSALFLLPVISVFCRSYERGSHCRLLAATLLLLGLYSAQKHKEVRFVHNVIVAHCIVTASTLVFLCRWAFSKRSALRKVVLYLITAVYVIYGCCHLPDSHSEYNRKWSYGSAALSQDVNECLYHTSQQNDVTGVFIDYTIHMTGMRRLYSQIE